MTTELQNLSWACLPKEVREEIKKRYKTLSTSFLTERYMELNNLFGHHNLTSDTEPQEMLMISLKKVKALYEDVLSDIENYKRDCDNGSPSAMFGRAIGMKQMLLRLFGDKCLPDTKVINEARQIAEESVKCLREMIKEKPTSRFSKGDKVKIVNVANPMMRDEIGIIEELPTKDESRYKVRFEEDHWTLLEARYLEPYTEPETKDMEEKELNPDEDFKMGDDVYLGTKLLGKFVCYSYSEHYKEVMVDVLIESGKDREANQGGWFAKDVSKTPQKPKRWTPKDGEKFWYINNLLNPISRFYDEEEPEDNDMISVGNCFQTYELCQQAAEAVRECLEKFHEQKCR